MSTDVRLAAPEQTIREVATAMKEIDAGSMPVAENDRLVGYITDRDIAIRAVAEGCGPDTPVRDIMSSEIRYCFEDDSLEDVASQMATLQVRRLPVLSREKRLVGIIALGDIAQADHADTSPAGVAISGVSETAHGQQPQALL
jgi:CBS domain-containing protein